MGSTQQPPDLIEYGRIRYLQHIAGARAETVGPTTPWWYIVVSKEFFSTKYPEGAGFWSKEGILLHEGTHASFDSEDISKSQADPLDVRITTAQVFAEWLPDIARNNASNYQFFSEDVRHKKLGK